MIQNPDNPDLADHGDPGQGPGRAGGSGESIGAGLRELTYCGASLATA